MTEGSTLAPQHPHPGLERSAQSVDDALADILRTLQTSRLPHAEELALLFSLSAQGPAAPFRFVPFLTNYLAVERSDVGMTLAEVASYSLALGQLEDSLIKIHDALKWSETKSSLQWWIHRRVAELGLSGLLIVASPGSTRTFEVERSSSLQEALVKLSGKVPVGQEVLARASKFRLLTVPYRDGAEALWHPISLGHELGHLRFTEEWVDGWIAGQPIEGASRAVSQAINVARALTERTASTYDWYVQARDWLMETACDTVLAHFYGEPGLQALRAYLDVHSAPSHTATHPSPDLRLWVIQSDEPHPDAAELLDKSVLPTLTNRLEVFQTFAPLIRSTVATELEGNYAPEGRDEVTRAALKRRLTGEPPNSGEWGQDVVRESPSTVETGLVASLWCQTPSLVEKLHRGEASGPGAAKEAASWHRRVQHAVDFLQFKHRFSQIAADVDVDTSSDDFVLSNTLHVSLTGVSSGPDSKARSSHDVRLGRHFIVFKRNATLSLNAASGSETRRVQEIVEIGWGEHFVLHPHEMVLAVTLESILMAPDCSAQVLSRSSLGRMGLLSATAVHVQPGFRGCLTLELVNLASIPLEISPGQRIAQIVPSPVCGTHGTYDGKYQDQDWRPKFSEANADKELAIIGRLGRTP